MPRFMSVIHCSMAWGSSSSTSPKSSGEDMAPPQDLTTLTLETRRERDELPQWVQLGGWI